MLEKLLTNGSSLTVLVVVVFIFLKHIKEEANRTREMQKEQMLEHLNARKESRDSIEKNTVAMTQNTEAVHELCQAVNNNR